MRPCPRCGTPLENQVKVCPTCGVSQEENRPEVQPQPDGPGVSGPAESRSFRISVIVLAVVIGLVVGGIAISLWGLIGITIGILAAAISFIARLMLQKSY